ncbi:MAG TPA: hypothetical protein VGD98_17330 [Ktedonobacteraceae bacterium]
MAQLESSLSQANMIATPGVGKGVKDLAHLRLVSGYILTLIGLVGLFGGDWDIQWHALIGRDRTFTPPHDLILLGIGLSGIVALLSILIETAWLRRRPDLQSYGSDFLGVLHSSLGLYLVGFGAVCAAVAFPLDTYWHSLYGIDVSLWAPFHTMIYMGGILSTFGVLYLLLSAAHLAEMQHERWTTILSYAGVVASLGILLSKFSTFLTPALSGHALHLASLTISLFPFLLAVVAVFICVLVLRLIPWLGAATMAIGFSLLLLLLLSTFIPPLMTLLVQAEHETYLARASRLGSIIVPLLGQTPVLLLAALCLDGLVWLGRRRQWALPTVRKWSLVALLASMFLVAGSVLVLLDISQRAARGGGVGLALVGLVLSLLLTIPGSLLGNWLASKVSESLQGLRR